MDAQARAAIRERIRRSQDFGSDWTSIKNTEIAELLNALDAAEARIAKLEAAVCFYADEGTWSMDSGQQARTALEEP